VEIHLSTLARDAHSGSAHALPSAAWRLVRLLASLKDEQENILIPGWYDGVQPPNQLDLEYLQALPSDEQEVKKELGLEEFLLGRTGLELAKAVFHPTCNIQGITSGYQGEGMKTIVPAHAAAKLDFRLVPGQSPDDLFPKLRSYLDACGFEDAVLTRRGSMYPYKASAEDPFIRLAQQLAPEVYGQALLINPLAGGSSPIYAFAGPLGDIPVLWAGVGGPNARAHSPDENIEIKNFLNGSRYIARILAEF
jgi:acetylornithine deacetylase/succinyl-diaminopimelate desuccinylase-like protein